MLRGVTPKRDSGAMARDKCFRCRKAKPDVALRSCEDFLCGKCSDYNDACLRARHQPDWESVVNGAMPAVPGAAGGSEVATSVSDEDETTPKATPEPRRDDDTIVVYSNEVVIDPILTYVISYRDAAPDELVRRVCAHHFSLPELRYAKARMWSLKCKEVLPLNIRRRDSSSRSEAEAIAIDIMEAVEALEAADCVPTCAVDPAGLRRLPKVSPAETTSISICERVAALEARMRSTEEALSSNVCKTLSIEDRVAKLTYSEVVSGSALRPPVASALQGNASNTRHVELHMPTSHPASQAISNTHTNSRQPAGRPPLDSRHIEQRPQQSSRQVVERPPQNGRQPANAKGAPRQRSDSVTSLDSSVSGPSAADEGFEYSTGQRRKKRRSKARAIAGTSLQSGTLRGAPEPSRHVFVYRVSKGTSDQDLGQFMSDGGVTVRSTERMSKDEARFESFKIEVKTSELETVLCSAFWPEGIYVRRFYTHRRKTETI